VGFTVALCSLGVASCGGGQRQDATEPEGDFPVSIATADFPAKQRIAESSELTLGVRNDGDQAIPDLAITIFTRRAVGPRGAAAIAAQPADHAIPPSPAAPGSFSVISQQKGLAIPSRPVWIIEAGYPKLAGESSPAGAEVAQTNTFGFGRLEPGGTIEVIWKLTPVQPGYYVVAYRIAAGLQGKAVAVTDAGGIPQGKFPVAISDAPLRTHVNDAGQVVPIKKSDVIAKAGGQ
jgi:hypothetical protein